MKRFRFTLARVLAVAVIRERQATQDFALALRQQRLAVEALNAAEERRRSAQRRLEELTSGVIDVPAVLSTCEYIIASGLEIEEQTRRVAEATAVTESKRQALLVAMKNRKTLERLRERRLSEYHAEQLRSEQADIDEMAQRITEGGQRHGRR
jgi:flagellar FliJ protein